MKVKCTCQHEGQDKLHGKGIRIATPVNKKVPKEFRCTVCSKEHRTTIDGDTK